MRSCKGLPNGAGQRRAKGRPKADLSCGPVGLVPLQRAASAMSSKRRRPRTVRGARAFCVVGTGSMLARGAFAFALFSGLSLALSGHSPCAGLHPRRELRGPAAEGRAARRRRRRLGVLVPALPPGPARRNRRPGAGRDAAPEAAGRAQARRAGGAVVGRVARGAGHLPLTARRRCPPFPPPPARAPAPAAVGASPGDGAIVPGLIPPRRLMILRPSHGQTMVWSLAICASGWAFCVEPAGPCWRGLGQGAWCPTRVARCPGEGSGHALPRVSDMMRTKGKKRRAQALAFSLPSLPTSLPHLSAFISFSFIPYPVRAFYALYS